MERPVSASATIAALPPIFGERRALTCPLPERIPIKALDGADLLLHRVRGGARGPVLLSPGTAMTGLTYLADSVKQNFVEFLAGEGFDVWLLDWRTSPLLEAHKHPYTMADVAAYDWPAAVAEVRRRTGSAQLSVLAHCLSSPAFLLSLVRGHTDKAAIRTFVASQVALHLRFTAVGHAKITLHMDALLPGGEMVHQKPGEGRLELGDLAASMLAHLQPGTVRCGNPACYRHAATFGELILHRRINEETHAIMGDLVPECLTAFLKDIAELGRQDSVLTEADRRHLDRLKLPIHFIAGTENRMFVPESTADTFRLLSEVNGPGHYTRTVYEDFGHLDFYFGEGAAEAVWPDLAAALGGPEATPPRAEALPRQAG